MKRFRIPIFTSEYFVNVLIWTRDEINKEGAKMCGDTVERFTALFDGKRWMACNLLLKMTPTHPLIVLDWDLPSYIALSTLAHEASHAMDYISEYMWMDDRSGEFRAHGIGEIMRWTTELILKTK